MGIAIRTSNQGTGSLLIPATAQVGDLMLLSAGCYSVQYTVPAGWTTLHLLNTTLGTYPEAAWVAWKFVAAGEPGTTITVASGQPSYGGVQLLVLSGANASAPIAASAITSHAGTDMSTGALTTTGASRRFSFVTQMANTSAVPTFTPPAGTTVVASTSGTAAQYHRSASYSQDATTEAAGTLAAIALTSNMPGTSITFVVAVAEDVRQIVSLPYTDDFETSATTADLFDVSDGGEGTWVRDNTGPAYSGTYSLRNTYEAGGHRKRWDKFKLPAGITRIALQFAARCNGLLDSWNGGGAPDVSQPTTLSLWNETDSVQVAGSAFSFFAGDLGSGAAVGPWVRKTSAPFAVDPSKSYRWEIQTDAWSGRRMVDIDDVTILADRPTNVPAVDATQYGRKLDRCQNNVRLMSYKDSEDVAKFKYSPDGVTWNAIPSMDIAGADRLSLFVDLDDYVHVVWKQVKNLAGRTDSYIYYMRGTPNQFRTSWTWSSAYIVGTSAGWNYPDIVAFREGTGWRAQIILSWVGGASSYASTFGVTITSGAAITVLAQTDIGGDYGTSSHTFPTIDFNHTGDGKTVAGGTPHLYAAWSAGAAGAGKGIRFKKATYAAGAWTWGVEREIDSAHYADVSAIPLHCMFDGTIVVIAGISLNTGAQRDHVIYARDAADTTTTALASISGLSNAEKLFGGGATYDGAHNIYLFGGSDINQTADISYIKYTAATGVLSPTRIVVGKTSNNPNYSSTSVKRGWSGSQLEWIYTDGNNAPYSVKYDSLTVSQTFTAALSLNAPGALLSGPFVGTSGTSGLSAPGNLSVGATRTTSAAVPLNAPGSLSTAATAVRSAAINLNAPGRLTAFTGQTANVLLNAPGFLSLAGTRTTFGGVSLAAPGALSVGATRTTSASLALSAPGALAVTGTRTTTGVVSLNAPGVMSSGSSRTTYATGTLSAPGNLSVAASRTTTAAVTLAAPGSISVGAIAGRYGAVNLLAPAALTSNPTRIALGTVSLLAPGHLTSGPQVWRTGAVNLNAPGHLTSNPIQYLVYIRDPADGLLKSCIVMARQKGTDPFSVAEVLVREVGTDPWTLAQR